MRQLLKVSAVVILTITGLAGIVVAGLWARSYWVCEALTDTALRYEARLCSERGQIIGEVTWWGGELYGGEPGWRERLDYRAGEIPPAPAPAWQWRPWQACYDATATRGWSVLGFGYRNGRKPPPPPVPGTFGGGGPILDAVAVAVPHWFVVGVLLSPSAWWLGVAWCRRRRQRLGLCPRCGYDLRSSAGTCPECGTAIAGSGYDAPR